MKLKDIIFGGGVPGRGKYAQFLPGQRTGLAAHKEYRRGRCGDARYAHHKNT